MGCRKISLSFCFQTASPDLEQGAADPAAADPAPCQRRGQAQPRDSLLPENSGGRGGGQAGHGPAPGKIISKFRKCFDYNISGMRS